MSEMKRKDDKVRKTETVAERDIRQRSSLIISE